MMSQLNTDAFVQKALRYGAAYFLAKPFNFDVLLKTLDEFSDGNDAPSQPAAAPVRTPAKRSRSLDERLPTCSSRWAYPRTSKDISSCAKR